MVRFKVVKGSRLLLGLAIAVLVIVLGILMANYALSDGAAQTGAEAFNAFALLSNAEETEDIFGIPQDELLPAEEVKPRVLIYHTHTHEAYRQTEHDPYEAVEAWRTLDMTHSVVQVGAELAKELEARGFEVVHDTTDHEKNALGSAYLRSEETLKQYEGKFDAYIDLHRDAYIKGAGAQTVEADGKQAARLMMLIGRGDAFTVKPYYAENLAFAEELTETLNRIQPNICKEVLVKENRYNQHVGVHAVLLEVGNNENTLEEACNAMPTFAEALCEVLG